MYTHEWYENKPFFMKTKKKGIQWKVKKKWWFRAECMQINTLYVSINLKIHFYKQKFSSSFSTARENVTWRWLRGKRPFVTTLHFSEFLFFTSTAKPMMFHVVREGEREVTCWKINFCRSSKTDDSFSQLSLYGTAHNNLILQWVNGQFIILL